jgi:lysylphosphatidylglycerol synthetase-like protein (DUF2156 family)
MKIITFYRLSVFAAILFLLLACILMFAPAQMLTSWGVELTVSVGLMARRIAALYTGLAVMFFMVRNAEHSTTRTALIYGVVTSCLMLAGLGAYELYAGHASTGIIPAVLIEVALALAFTYVACNCNGQNTQYKKGKKS